MRIRNGLRVANKIKKFSLGRVPRAIASQHERRVAELGPVGGKLSLSTAIRHFHFDAGMVRPWPFLYFFAKALAQA